jgi:acyl-CoA synthetase (AMP-forming)/AMP-acid ligase II
MTDWHVPRDLSELFPVFERLETGVNVALTPAGSPLGTGGEPPDSEGSWLGVTSSGSTGVPKLIWRRWWELRASAAKGLQCRDWLWASPYAPWTFAGVQVALQAWLTSRRLVTLGGHWDRVWSALLAQPVQALSATPTFVDLLLQNEPAAAATWQPIQVTLGGEPLRPVLGARLIRRFPSAHFTVIYAAAEFGVLARTRRVDGWYERASLDRHCDSWRASAGVLEVRRDGQWRSTGDRVEVEGPFVKIVGRADSVANVAGTKVFLPTIAELAEQVDGIRRAVAVAEPNAVTGQVVCLRFAVEPGRDPEAIEAALQADLRERLPKESWPRRWIRDEVAPAQNAKRVVR